MVGRHISIRTVFLVLRVSVAILLNPARHQDFKGDLRFFDKALTRTFSATTIQELQRVDGSFLTERSVLVEYNVAHNTAVTQGKGCL